MKKDFTNLITAIEKGKRPDLRELSQWMFKQQISGEDWERVSDVLKAAYGFADDGELANAIKFPTFTTDTGYVDDFSPMMLECDMKGWVRDYVEHTRNMEAPTPYHFASALTVLGSALHRQVHVDQGYYKIWPAMQTLLIGPSGKTKKSTAAGYAVQLGEESKRVHRLLDEGSQEALKTELYQISKRTGAATGLLYASELGTFLGKQDYNQGLVQALTDLFDSRTGTRRRTQARGNEGIENIAVSFLGCSNEDWLADSIPPSAFGGGFMGRILTYYQSGTDRVFPRPRVLDTSERDALLEGLLRTQYVNGVAVTTPAADKWFDARYRQLKREWPDDERLVPFWERIPDHLLRVGMLLSISEDLAQRDSISIEERHLQQADALIRWIVRYLPRVYSFLGGTQFGTDQQRIISIIRRKGGTISEAELGRKMSSRLSRKQLDEHLSTMIANRVLDRIRTSDVWEGKTAYRLKRRVEEVL